MASEVGWLGQEPLSRRTRESFAESVRV